MLSAERPAREEQRQQWVGALVRVATKLLFIVVGQSGLLDRATTAVGGASARRLRQR